MCKSLINSHDIIKYGKVFSRYIGECSVVSMCPFEETIFSECIGIDFYYELKAAEINYTNFTKYDSNVAYSFGDVVSYKDVLYTSLINNNDESPNNDTWTYSPKFNKECLNDAWCNYLVHIVALFAAKETQKLKIVTINDNGSVRYNTETVKAATLNEINAQVQAINGIMTDILTNFKRYVKRNNTNGCFDKTLFLSGCCNTCKEIECTCDAVKCETKSVRLNYWKFA